MYISTNIIRVCHLYAIFLGTQRSVTFFAADRIPQKHRKLDRDRNVKKSAVKLRLIATFWLKRLPQRMLYRRNRHVMRFIGLRTTRVRICVCVWRNAQYPTRSYWKLFRTATKKRRGNSKNMFNVLWIQVESFRLMQLLIWVPILFSFSF